MGNDFSIFHLVRFRMKQSLICISASVWRGKDEYEGVQVLYFRLQPVNKFHTRSQLQLTDFAILVSPAFFQNHEEIIVLALQEKTVQTGIQ